MHQDQMAKTGNENKKGYEHPHRFTWKVVERPVA